MMTVRGKFSWTLKTELIPIAESFLFYSSFGPFWTTKTLFGFLVVSPLGFKAIVGSAILTLVEA